MGTTTISLSEKAYKVLKAHKMKGESFSDLILRKFGRGNPSSIVAYLQKTAPNVELADAVEQSSKDLGKKFKLKRVEL